MHSPPPSSGIQASPAINCHRPASSHPPCCRLAGKVLTINACLAPVGSLAGYHVLTAAGVGNSKQGFHPVQGALRRAGGGGGGPAGRGDDAPSDAGKGASAAPVVSAAAAPWP